VVLDSSRYAARRAAGAHPRALAVVGDTWARLPVRDAAVDRVLVVFAPRNGPETARVLRPGGRLVVVTPAADHLAELVGPLGLLQVDPDKARRLAATLEPHLRPVAGARHRERLELDRAAVTTLVGMGPHARHLSPEGLAAAVAGLPERTAVTVSVDVTTWTRAG
jgi:23S rRNA (guanine745-N1)-methyltransferase